MIRFAKQFKGHAYSPAGELLCSGRRPAQGLSNCFAFANLEAHGEVLFWNLRARLARARGIFQQKNIRVLKSAAPCAQNGFIALMTAIILSVVLLVVTIALNQAGFLARSEILESEYKNRSSALAEGCVDIALLKIAEDFTYAGNESGVPIDTDTCGIGIVAQDTPISGQTTIFSNAVFPSPSVTSMGAVTKLKVVINSADLSVVSWEELP